MIVSSPADYRDSDAVSFSKLKVFEACPLLYYRLYVERSIRREDDETKALRIGSAAHCMLLEGPLAFSQRYVVQPETYASEKGETKEWNNNAAICRAWNDNQRLLGRTVMARGESDLLVRMREALRTNDDAVALLATGLPELAIRRDYPSLGLQIQGRLDWWAPQGVVVDLKTIEDLDDLPAEIERRRYYSQLAFYRHLAGEEYAFDPEFIRCAIIGVEKKEPFRCGVYYLSPELLAIGDAYNWSSLANLARAFKTGEWGGNPTTREVGPSPELRFAMMEKEAADAG